MLNKKSFLNQLVIVNTKVNHKFFFFFSSYQENKKLKKSQKVYTIVTECRWHVSRQASVESQSRKKAKIQSKENDKRAFDQALYIYISIAHNRKKNSNYNRILVTWLITNHNYFI